MSRTCYLYTLTTFEKVIKKNGLKILDFSLNDINGGSIEITCCKKNSKHKTNKLKIDIQRILKKKLIQKVIIILTKNTQC